jgi:hypothetical protein
LDDAFEQALTVVYRLVFLLFAEARALVPVWHPVRESYSLDALRTLVEGTKGPEGIWEALRAITRLAHAGCLAVDLKVTPFNGRLFAPARTPLAERQELDEEAAQRAILALSTRQSDRGGRERIAYRDLGVEQLGAVYETLLDYEPVRAPHVMLRPGSGVRKATGTFYTPQPIAEYLVRRTLGPLVHDASPERILQLRIVDPSMGSGAFRRRMPFLAGAKRPSFKPGTASRATSASRACVLSPHDCRALPLWRGPQSDGRAARAAVALAHDARRRSAAQFSRSSSAGRRQLNLPA